MLAIMKNLALAVGIVTLAWIGSGQSVEQPRAESPRTIQNISLMIPVLGVEASQLRDTFNEGRVGHTHDALDIMAPRGTPVIAAVDGTVRKLFTSRLGGLTIYEFDDAQTRSYYYAHLDRYANVWEGQRIKRGDVIGYVGSTGNANTPHLHFAIAQLPPTHEWWKGEAVNPFPELVRNGVTKRASALPERPSGSD
jgi:murein DD-endopeptidase MepM/ murein hydrolase activator NlpD